MIWVLDLALDLFLDPVSDLIPVRRSGLCGDYGDFDFVIGGC